jgi:hypothetical protein
MKLITEQRLVEVGEFVKTDQFSELHQNIVDGILTVSWADPHEFIINPIPKANGVLPIKNNFIAHLVTHGWEPEVCMSVVDGLNPGPIDAIFRSKYGIIAVEWETGNISSSHRALNKIALGIIQKQLIAGFLIIPMRSLSKYLTDRVGNYEELSPYFPLYPNLKISEGVMSVFGVEHDRISSDVVLIPKGSDGNAKKSIQI